MRSDDRKTSGDSGITDLFGHNSGEKQQPQTLQQQHQQPRIGYTMLTQIQHVGVQINPPNRDEI